jgi:competence protein ComEA
MEYQTFLEGSYFILQYIKFIIAGCVLAVALCGCGRQVKLLTSETQTETQMMDDAGGEETVVSSAEAFATTTTEAETPEQEQSDDVAVYVCGAVRQPGVYYVAGSAIRETAVQMAGGFTDDADVTYVNLAQTVVAGEQIYIPTMEETNGISLSERDTDGTPVQDAPAGTNVENATHADASHVDVCFVTPVLNTPCTLINAPDINATIIPHIKNYLHRQNVYRGSLC